MKVEAIGYTNGKGKSHSRTKHVAQGVILFNDLDGSRIGDFGVFNHLDTGPRSKIGSSGVGFVV